MSFPSPGREPLHSPCQFDFGPPIWPYVALARRPDQLLLHGDPSAKGVTVPTKTVPKKQDDLFDAWSICGLPDYSARTVGRDGIGVLLDDAAAIAPI